MNEWGVVLALSVLVGLFVAVGKPIFSLITTLTRLNSSVDSLNLNLENLGRENDKEHQKLWLKNTEQDNILREHGQRLHDLDGKWGAK